MIRFMSEKRSTPQMLRLKAALSIVDIFLLAGGCDFNRKERINWVSVFPNSFRSADADATIGKLVLSRSFSVSISFSYSGVLKDLVRDP